MTFSSVLWYCVLWCVVVFYAAPPVSTTLRWLPLGVARRSAWAPRSRARESLSTLFSLLLSLELCKLLYYAQEYNWDYFIFVLFSSLHCDGYCFFLSFFLFQSGNAFNHLQDWPWEWSVRMASICSHWSSQVWGWWNFIWFALINLMNASFLFPKNNNRPFDWQRLYFPHSNWASEV